jgi:hypothetical protein
MSGARYCKPSRSPGIDSQPGGIDSSESIPELHKRLQTCSGYHAFSYMKKYNMHMTLQIFILTFLMST